MRRARLCCVVGVGRRGAATALDLHSRSTHRSGTHLTPVVLLHGLLGNSKNWGHFMRRVSFAADRQIHALDMRNHGGSPWSDEMNYRVMAEDVKHWMEGHGISSAVVLGHSMGGKAAMELALSFPDVVEALVVADIAPREYEGHVNESLDAMVEVLDKGLHTKQEAEALLKHTHPDPMLRGFVLSNAHLHKKGKPLTWRPNVRVLQRSLDALLRSQFDLAGREYDGPCMMLRGSKSHYVRVPEDIDLMRAHFPTVDCVTIEGAGHWVHSERPHEFEEAVNEFLSHV
eukprot:Hpha_TRINITY_DN27780_c0_g1::TRINITY_DN27780_c0_g1_i1::g.157157::m.157157